MLEKTREVPQLADTTYAHTLVIKSTHEYKVHGSYGSNFPCTIGELLCNTYNLWLSMSITLIAKVSGSEAWIPLPQSTMS